MRFLLCLLSYSRTIASTIGSQELINYALHYLWTRRQHEIGYYATVTSDFNTFGQRLAPFPFPMRAG